MSEEASKPEETPTSPEMKLGCLTGFAGVCLLLVLPRMSVVLIVVGAVLFFFPHYLLLPVGQPKDPKTGEVKPRPTYSASARAFTYSAFALAVLLGYYGLQKDLGRVFAPQSAPPPPPPVSAPPAKVTSTIVYEVTGSADSASLTYQSRRRKTLWTGGWRGFCSLKTGSRRILPFAHSTKIGPTGEED